jgi:GNAT superfamily N-acetyltransferase
LEILPATIDDIEVLNTIAFVAKAHWGYPPEWMTAWRSELRLTEAQFAKQIVLKAVIKSEIEENTAGWIGLQDQAERMWVENLWVWPAYMGKGVGRALLEKAIEEAKRLGKRKLALQSDPNAPGFYERMGMRRVGERVISPTRSLPLFELTW